ncbi:DUF1761 domain-containing protein [Flavobacterium psychrotolerans]|uniref:DUF1761 domain-containing protein n=1 Tax=Flavobacterium psychrotolerans TaxID=2169410 RepID=A0A2U1JFP2_9FLAO|nr:DUF1761 domain-containing protein [Flavobacterium psychrotolerans]PWA03946.1 DUF1761 domain-containing protein [Flavobacterium psychrotolerans]
MEFNFLAILVAAASTLVVGFVWYHPKVFGDIWMKESGMTQEKMKGGNMLLTFVVSFIYAFLIAIIIRFLAVHQTGALSMVGGDASIAKPSFNAFMADYGMAFRTYKHGALHGFIAGIFFAIPLIGTNALYERRSFKYTLVTGGFWTACFTIMGAIICGWV